MKNKTILVTGSSCFVGYHLVLMLQKSGYKVFGTISKACELYKGIQKKRLSILKKIGFKFEVVDLANIKNVKELIHRIKPNYIFHIAAHTTGLRENNFSLEKSSKYNLKFIENIYSSLKEESGSKLIIASTNAEYTSIEGKVNEDSSCETPFSDYGKSKLVATQRALEIAENKKIKTVVARIFNPVGPYDAENKLLPQVINALKKKEDINLSPCIHKRDFIYIDRLIEGMIKMMNFLDETKKYKNIMNLSYGKPTEIKTLLIKIAKCIDADESMLRFGILKLRANEPIINYGDNSVAKKELEWSPGDIFEDVTMWLKNK